MTSVAGLFFCIVGGCDSYKIDVTATLKAFTNGMAAIYRNGVLLWVGVGSVAVDRRLSLFANPQSKQALKVCWPAERTNANCTTLDFKTRYRKEILAHGEDVTITYLADLSLFCPNRCKQTIRKAYKLILKSGYRSLNSSL